MVKKLDILAFSPPGFASASTAIAAYRAGYPGGVSLEHTDIADARRVLDRLFAARVDFCLMLPRLDESWRGFVSEISGPGWVRVVLTHVHSTELGEQISLFKARQVEVFVEAIGEAEARHAESCGADGVMVKGCEAGGRVGEETTFVLLQRIVPRLSIPVYARGGVGLNSAAACLAGGASGVALDWQLGLCAESALPDSVKSRIARMDGSETAVLGQTLGERYRAYTRPGEEAFAALSALEDELTLQSVGGVSHDGTWRTAVERRTRARGDDRLLLFGQDAVLAAGLNERFQTVGAVCGAIRSTAKRQCQLAARQNALRPGGPLAASHGTRFPIVQGPMTRVSDTADFALAVAGGGGLPFLALALLRGPQVAALLEETKRQLGSLPWGVGILGFVPRELREEQLAEVRKHPPPFALIAGGRPDQAAELERENIHTYLHVPSPGLLKMFLESGARRVIFEGRECGGHVGPRTSFVLWEQMIRVILDHLAGSKTKPEDHHVLFAGGIHDAVSASMVAAMAAPLVERGVRIGVLLGTSYLFTKEAVTSGAIVKGFQQEALGCRQTILLESGVGHATRCADTPFGQVFAEEKRRLFAEGKSKEEIREALETLNLGRLRIASKGITRADGVSTAKFKELAADEQRHEGMYMIGQVAALRDRVCTIEELHDDVSRLGVERLRAFDEPTPSLTAPNAPRPSDVAIVGMSCFFPKANNLRTFWGNVLNKFNAIGEIPADRWDWKDYFDADRTAKDKIYSKWGGFLDDVLFDPTTFGMPPNSLPSIDPLQLLVLEGVRDALRDAGYIDRPFNRERTSVVLGAGGGVADLGLGYGFRALLPHFMKAAGGTSDDAAALIDRLESALPEWTEDSFAGLLMNVAAGRVANRFDLGGSNYTVDAACASSLAAVRLGVGELETGTADMVIVGGADTMQSPFAYLCFSKTQALSPTGQCKTFDSAADGIVISEGIAFAILKRLADAERDGDRIYAVIKGVGSSSDGRDKGLTAPRPAGQIRALERAYEKAGYSPKTVGLVEAHGTGTVAGDQSEVESLTKTFTAAGAHGQQCALGSVKSLIGHTKCTAGVAGMVKAALALHHKALPPTHGVTVPNPKAKFSQSPFYINTQTRPWLQGDADTPRRAGVSAFGFGGTNFHAALEEYRGESVDTAQAPLKDRPAELFAWRGESARSLVAPLEALRLGLTQGSKPNLADLAAAVGGEFAGREDRCSLGIVASSLDELVERIDVALAALKKDQAELRDPRGVYFSVQPIAPADKIAFLFPGQGSQSVNMLRDLAVALPGVREVFEEADRGLGSALGRPLSSFIFPRPAFTPEELSADEAAITQTQVAQPAMGAAALAMHRVLESLGIHPDMTAGHSYGEYVALAAAGVWSVADLMRVSEARGRLIGQAGAASPGVMAAIDADENTVGELLRGATDVWVANLNSPGQTVISGTASAVDDIVAKVTQRGINGRRIKVSCAFHSGLVAAAQAPFQTTVENVSCETPRIPVYSNTTAGPHLADPAAIRRQLVEHLVRPVRFADQLSAMYADGARVFIEVGPRAVLSGLAEKTLAGLPVTIVSTDQPGRNGLVHLCHTLARLYSVGVPMRLAPLFAGRTQGVVSVAQALAAGKPAAPSATTWRVNGARAIPYHAPAKPVVAKPVEPLRLTSTPTSPVPSSAPVPAPSLVATDNGVMSSYQAMMSKFLDTQKNVMLAYLQGGNTVAPIPAAAPRVESPAPAPVAETKPAPMPTQTGWSSDKIADRLVKIVSERTGYPRDMLNLDLDMEADLGIDSIKRVEILGTLQSESILPGKSLDRDMETLAKLKTLRAIVNWIAERAASDAAPAPVEVRNAPTAIGETTEAVVRRTLAILDAPIPTRSRLELSGVALLVDDGSHLASDLASALDARGIKSAILNVNAWTDRSATIASLASIRKQQGAIGAVICLPPASRPPSDPGILDPAPARAELLGLFTLIQALERDLRDSKARLLVVRRMDGAFGEVHGTVAFNPADGGACGLVKSIAREWTDVQCRILDIGSIASTAQSVSDILAEWECADDLVEVGRLGGKRVTLGVAESALPATRTSISLSRDDVVLITGGGRGITAEIATELAERFQCRLVLCGRSPLPEEAEDPTTANLSDMRALKAAVRAQIESAGGTPAPASIESAYAKLLRDRDIRATLAAIRAAGAKVEYHLVDVADTATFGALIDGIYTKHGRLDGVIHGAGVTEDKFLADKTVESFERVMRPKIDGGFTLAARLRLDVLKFLTFFSSVSARYGNRGQSDYAAANEVLNKLARRLNPRCHARVTALNWGPWESTGGMVSPELAKQFAKAGVQMITRPVGRRLFVDELLFGRKDDAEVIFGGPLTVSGALAPTPPRPAPADAPVWPLLNCRSRVTRTPDGGTEVSRELDPSFDLYLLDHQLDGKPVMPMVVGLELLSEVATSVVAAGLQIACVRDLRVLRGITIEQGSRTIRVSASAPRIVEDGVEIDLRAKTDTERPTLSYTAVARLAAALPQPPRRDNWGLIEPRAFSMSVGEAYEQWLFHGPLFAGIVEVERIGENGIIGRLSPSSPSRCLAETSPNVRWIMDPVVLDSGLQLLILWARTYREATPLPSRFAAFHRFGDLSAGEVRCEARVRPGSENNPVVHSDLFFYDLQGRLIGLLEDMEFACSKALNRLGHKRAESAGT